MDEQSGLEPDMVPTLDEFLLARLAEDKRIATDAAAATPGGWAVDPGPGSASAHPHVVEHVVRHDPERVLAECAAKRRLVMACRDSGFDRAFLGSSPHGMADFLLNPRDRHQLAALTLALLALPYADHSDYRPEWRP